MSGNGLAPINQGRSLLEKLRSRDGGGARGGLLWVVCGWWVAHRERVQRITAWKSQDVLLIQPLRCCFIVRHSVEKGGHDTSLGY